MKSKYTSRTHPLAPIIRALKQAGIKSKDIDPDFEFGGMIAARTKYFNIRVLKAREGTDCGNNEIEFHHRIQFAWRKTFDRWANSTNFETEAWETIKENGERKWTIPYLDLELAWCKRAAESGVFDFHTYFDTIKTPWFIYREKKS